MSKLSIKDQAFQETSMILCHYLFEQLDSKHVTYSDMLHNSALVDMQGKAYRSAMTKFDKAIIANSKHYPSFFNRARLCIVINKPLKAIQDFLTCTKIKPMIL